MPRPTVAVRTGGESGNWPGAKEAVAWCSTVVEDTDTGEIKSCQFFYVASVKVDAQEKAKVHRDWHHGHPGIAWQDRTTGNG